MVWWCWENMNTSNVIDTQTDRQTGRHNDRQTGRHIDRQAGKLIDR